MKKCITRKALCILLSALLTVSVFATCLVFSASASGMSVSYDIPDGVTVQASPYGTVDVLVDGVKDAETPIVKWEGNQKYMFALRNGTGAVCEYTLTLDLDGKKFVKGVVLSILNYTSGNVGLPEAVTFEVAGESFTATIGEGNAQIVDIAADFGKSVEADKIVAKVTYSAESNRKYNMYTEFSFVEGEAPVEEPSTAPSESKNLALNATVLNTPEYVDNESQWPCSYNGKVNDGIIAEYGALGMAGVDWAAFYYNNDSAKNNFDGKVGEIVLDFGSVTEFSSFRTHIYGTGGSGIAEIEKVEFFVSDDNSTWTSVGSVTENLTGEGAWAELEAEASGRYVKYAYTKSSTVGGVFLFISECEA